MVPEITLKISPSLDKKITVTGNIFKHRKWLKNLQNLMVRSPTHPHVCNTLVFTVASQKDWGDHLNNRVLSDLWSSKESQLHINVLLLKAVLLALKGFQDHLKG